MRSLALLLLLFVLAPLPANDVPSTITAASSLDSVQAQAVSGLPVGISYAPSPAGEALFFIQADVDGDGRPDFVLFENASGNYVAEAFSGYDGSKLRTAELSHEPINATTRDSNGLKILVATRDGSNTYVEILNADGSTAITNELFASVDSAEFSVGENFAYVIGLGDATHVAAIDSGLRLIATKDLSAGADLAISGDVMIVSFSNGSAFYVTVASAGIAVGKIDDYFASAKALDSAYVVRANGKVYLVSFQYSGYYTVSVEDVGKYLSVGDALMLGEKDLLVSDGSAVIRFYYNNTSNARENKTINLPSQAYALLESDYDADGTAEVLVVAASGIYELELTNYSYSAVSEFPASISDLRGVMISDEDAYPGEDFFVVATPVVFALSGSGYAAITISVSVDEYAFGLNGLYVKDPYDVLRLYAYNGTLVAEVDETIIGIDSGLRAIRTLHPEGREVLFARTDLGFIALNGTTLLPIRHLRSSPIVRVASEPGILGLISTGFEIYRVSPDVSDPHIDASFKLYYNPGETIRLNVSASDDVYLYKLRIVLENDTYSYSTEVPIYSDSYSGTVELSLNLTQGSYNVTISVSDGAGHKAVIRDIIYVDDGKPPLVEYVTNATFFYPNINGTIYLAFNVSDVSPVTVEIRYSLDGGVTRNDAAYENRRSIYNASITVSTYGEILVLVSATDAAGNHVDFYVTVYADDGQAPEVSIIAGDSYEVFSSDSVGAEIKDYTLGNVTIVLADPSGNVTRLSVAPGEGYPEERVRTFSINASFDAVGQRNLTVYAADLGNHSVVSVKLILVVDSEKPVIREVSMPEIVDANASFYAFVNASDNYYDELSIEILAGSVAIYNGTIPAGGAHITLSVPISGYVELEIIVTDGSGNSASVTVSVAVDDGLPPRISIAVPGTSEVYSSGYVSVRVEDALNTRTNVTLSVFDVVNGIARNFTLAENSPLSALSRNLTLDVVGERRVYVVSSDQYGRVASSEAGFNVTDNEAPSVAISAPELVDVGQTAEVIVNVSDNYAFGRPEVEVEINNESVGYEVLFENSSFVSIRVSFTPEEPGEYVLTVTAADALGNAASSSASIRSEDLTAPSVTLEVPARRLVMSPMDAIIYASDNYAVSLVTAYYSRDNATRKDVDAVREGDHRRATIVPDELGTLYLKVLVRDPAGHEGSAYAAVEIYDDVPPSARLEIPASVANGENVTIRLLASDNYRISSVEIYVSYDNSSRIKLDAMRSDRYREASFVPDQTGTVYVKAIVIDAAGNETVVLGSFEVTLNVGATFAAVAIVALLVALIVAIARLRRR